MAWTEQRIEALTKLWIDGLSAAQIAVAVGWCSRSAVLGKVHRLGLPERKTRTAGRYVRRARGEPRAARIRRVVIRPGRSKIYGGEIDVVPIRNLPRELPAAAIPPEQRKSFLELDWNHCRWIYGDPCGEHFYCGGEADMLAGRPYCPFHAMRAINL